MDALLIQYGPVLFHLVQDLIKRWESDPVFKADAEATYARLKTVKTDAELFDVLKAVQKIGSST